MALIVEDLGVEGLRVCDGWVVTRYCEEVELWMVVFCFAACS